MTARTQINPTSRRAQRITNPVGIPKNQEPVLEALNKIAGLLKDILVTSKTAKVPKRLYTISEAAKYLGRTQWGVRTLIWNATLPVIRDGRKLYIDVNDLEKYVERHKETME